MQLSQEKFEILKDTSHNIKIIAGPGSGKTTILIEKIKLLVEQGVSPKRILLITYTNRASKDLIEKINQKIPNKKGFYVSTMHKFGNIFMKENPDYFTKYKEFKVLDDYGQFLFLIKFSDKIKENLITLKPKKLKDYFGRIKDNYFFEEIESIDFELKKPYLNYCRILNDNKNFDFGDLIHTVIKEIKLNKNLENLAKSKFDYIFVDEYQDTNKVQEELIKLFLGKNTKIWIVGDKNQSIYGFRGSDLTLFDNFEKKFPNTKTYTMEKNYRSTQKIIDFSNIFMSLDKLVLGNNDSNDGEVTPNGSKIQVKNFDEEENEIIGIVDYIKHLKNKKIIENYSDIGILFKSVKYQAKEYIKALENEKIPIEVIGDGGLLNLDYIHEILSVFNELKNNDSKISNEFLELEIPKKNILAKRSLLDAFYEIISNSNWFKNKIRNGDEEVLFNVAKFSELLKANQSMFDTKIEEFYEYFKKNEKDYFDTEQPKDTRLNSIKILTFHKAKGLEFPIVIIPKIEKNFYLNKDHDFLKSLFPNYSPYDDFRRAKYVAITRAKDLLVFSYINHSPEVTDVTKHPKLIYVESNKANNLFPEKEENLIIRVNKEKKDILDLNHYKIEEFLKCPFSYKLRFYNEFYTSPTYQLYYGAELHNAIYHLNLKLSKGENIDLDEIIAKLNPKIMNRDKLIGHLEQYLDDFKGELKENLIFPEKPFNSIVNDAIIRGKIDLIMQKSDGTKIICEFKSGKHNQIFEEKAKRQLELYFLALNDPKIKKGIIYFFGNGGKKIVFEFSPQTNLRLGEIVYKIQSKQFEPDTKNCNLINECVFASFCPYFNKNAVSKLKNEDYEDDDADLEFEEY